MNILELREQIDASIEYAVKNGDDPTKIEANLQIIRGGVKNPCYGSDITEVFYCEDERPGWLVITADIHNSED